MEGTAMVCDQNEEARRAFLERLPPVIDQTRAAMRSLRGVLQDAVDLYPEGGFSLAELAELEEHFHALITTPMKGVAVGSGTVMTTDAIREAARGAGLDTAAKLKAATKLSFVTCQKVFRSRVGEPVFHEKTLIAFTRFFKPEPAAASAAAADAVAGGA